MEFSEIDSTLNVGLGLGEPGGAGIGEAVGSVGIYILFGFVEDEREGEFGLQAVGSDLVGGDLGGEGDEEFFDFLIAEEGVGLVPGGVGPERGDGWEDVGAGGEAGGVAGG